MEAVSAQLVGFGAISKAGEVPYRKTSEWRMLEALEPGPSREEGTSWEGAAHWCWQGVRAEPAVLAGVFVPNLLTLPSCCTNVFVHWECEEKGECLMLPKWTTNPKILLTKEYYLRWQ